MTAPPDDKTADTSAIIAALRTERDAALSEKATLAEALAQRNSEYGERIEQQAATIDVLKAMSASPGDARPVFELIVERARSFCGADHATAALLQDDMLHLQAHIGMSAAYGADYAAQFPRPVDTSTMFGRAILSRDVMQTGNVRAERDHFARQMHTVDFHSIVAVPIFREGTPIGAIALGQNASGGFTDTQIELLKTFAEQAVIAIISAETYRSLQTRSADLQQSLEYQAATIDVLKVMSSSTSDTRPVFEIIVGQAMRLSNGTFGALFEYDGEQLHVGVMRGFAQDALEAYASGLPRQPDRSNVMDRAILDQQTIYVPDYHAANPEAPQVVRDLGYNSFLAVPLRREGTVLGVIVVAHKDIGAFTDAQIELVKTFAEQAVIAIGSTATFRALQTRTSDLQESLEYQTATSDVLKVISRSAFDLQPVLATLLKTAARLCDAETAGMTSREGDTYRVVATFSNAPAFDTFIQGQSFTANRASVTGRTALEGHIIHIADLAADPEYAVAEAVTLGGVRTLLGVPLLREGEVAGVIILGRLRVEPFTDRQIELVSTFADQAVIAIENTRLITEQREALEQQTATAEVLQVINANPGNLTPVFDAILDKAHALCGAVLGSLVLFDGTYFRAVAAHGWPASIMALIREPTGPNRARQSLVDGERFVQVADIRAIGRGPNSAWGDALVEGTDARTMLLVPLRKDGALLGFISAFRPEVRVFSDKEIVLLENFAAQAVIAMENARLLTEQQEALEQQTATAEVLQVINASPGNLMPVFDAMLEKALRLCDATFGMFWQRDGESFYPAALHGVPKAFADHLMRNPVRPSPNSGLGRTAEGEPFVHITDIADSDAYRSGDPQRRALVDLGGGRTALWVSLRRDGRVPGVFTIYRKEVRPFTDKQIALLQNFAAQAVIAMENARLLTEQREALEQQTATAEVLQVINASPGNLAPVFDAMLEKAMRLLGAAFGLLYTRDGDDLRFAAQRGVPAAFAELRAKQPPVVRPGSALDRLYATNRPVHVLDLMAEPDSQTDGQPAIVVFGGARTLLMVPLRKDATSLGHIALYRQETQAFSDKQIALLENFAAQAVIAMENARLITETREALERQTATAEVLRIINENPGNLGPVFDVILEKALSLAEAAFGSLWIYHGDTMHAAATRGMTPALAEFRARNPVLAVPPVAREASETRRAVQMLDIRESESYRAGRRASRAIADLGGARTNLVVPLLKDNEGVGCIQIYRQEVRVFTPQQISLLEGFAAQAVIAMDNARLLNEIRQRQNELDITFENMGDGVAMFDRDHRLAAWNRNFQDILNLPDEAVRVGLPFADYIRGLAARGEYGPDANADEQIARLTMAVGQANRFERTRPNGRIIDVRHNPIQDGGFVVIYADITERKRAEEALRVARDEAETALRELKVAQANLVQAEKMASLGQLTAGIAHEIKNPLNFVNNFSALSTELIDELRDVLAPEPLGETARTEVDSLTALLKGNLEKVVQHGQRADGIVKSMLDHSRGSSGERRMVDLNALIDEALNLAYHGARAQDQSFNITLERDFGAGIAPIEVNPQDMTRMFLNLFSNGFYAATRRARDGGDAGFVPTLRVTTRDTGDAVEIRVRDNGTGIPADIRDKLFQPFFTTKPTGEGTGLSLSITYDIVTQQHGGNIAVDSKVGEYSEFTIQLPRNP